MLHYTKYFILTICAVFILGNIAYADTTLSVQSKSASPADTITVPIVLESDSQLSALSTDLSFNPEKLKFEEANIGAAASNKKIVTNKMKPGKVRIGLISMDSTALNDGELITVTFSVDPEAKPGEVQIEQEVSGSTPEGEEAEISGKAGTIDVNY